VAGGDQVLGLHERGEGGGIAVDLDARDSGGGG
jgi:hypothetical protein